ncbi:hypothetical protein [Sulfitobacter albidus]|uniref:hypothetical protein n=1 Tax=Sulfitobacter albidus TaxID=2829501 RepID=UPI0020C89E51|nr:hypothetical protein [Sulfitobacter albidus]
MIDIREGQRVLCAQAQKGLGGFSVRVESRQMQRPILVLRHTSQQIPTAHLDADAAPCREINPAQVRGLREPRKPARAVEVPHVRKAVQNALTDQTGLPCVVPRLVLGSGIALVRVETSYSISESSFICQHSEYG